MAAVNGDPQLRIRTAPPRSASPARQRLQITVPRVRTLAMQMGSPRTQRTQLDSPRAQKVQMSSYLSPVTQGAYITLVLSDKVTHFSGVGVVTCPSYWVVSDEKFTVIKPIERENRGLRPQNDVSDDHVHLPDDGFLR
ncbi:hypothetical protein R1flu_022855 [Riccia fluitans]|uniref:Uncharacterized protein n=1 Tax=Riccia fluitans TaxID=41844 RepID=A0ABD1XR27_9MARC